MMRIFHVDITVVNRKSVNQSLI